MQIYVPLTEAVVLLLALATCASAVERCGGPYNTLSSDCRDKDFDYGTNSVCFLLDQRVRQPSPCGGGAVADLLGCSRHSGFQCDLLTYEINYRPTQARFHLRFYTDGTWSGQLGSRALRTGEGGTAATVAAAPPRLLRSPIDDVWDEPIPSPIEIPVVVTSRPPSDLPDVNATVSPSGPAVGEMTPPEAGVPISDTIPPRTDPPSAGSAGSDGSDGSAMETTPPPRTRIPKLTPPTSDRDGSVPTPGGTRVAYESEMYIQAFGPLRLDPALTELRLVGGRTEFGTKGTVAYADIDPKLLVGSPHLTSVWIANIDVGDQFANADYMSKFPSGLTELNLRNTRTRYEPNNLSALKNLQSLKLEQNYLSIFSEKISLPRLTLLDVTENRLTAFRATLPSLEVLQLLENPIAGLVVSDSQFKFLQGVQLKIDKSPTSPPPPVVFVPSPAPITDDAAPSAPSTPTPPANSAAPSPAMPGAMDDASVPSRPSAPSAPARPPATAPPLPSNGGSGVVLNDTSVNLNNTVAVPIGSLTELNGIPVWRVPDADFTVFKKQQEVLENTPNLIIGGQRVESYKATAAAAAAAADPEGFGASYAKTTPGQDTDAQNWTPTVPAASRTAPVDPNSNVPLSGTTATTPSANGKPSSANAVRDVQNPQSPSSAAATSGSGTKPVLISVAVVAAVAAIVAVLIFAAYRRRRTAKTDGSAVATSLASPDDDSVQASYALTSSTKPQSSGGGSSISSSAVSGSASLMTTQGAAVKDLFSSRRIRMADVQDVRPIGAATSGVVWLVKLRGARLLASKRLTGSSNQRMNQFVNEVVIAADLDHPSIIRLAGVAWTNETDLQALFDYMPNGDLQTHLYQTTSPAALPWSTATLQMAIDIIEALVYTHSFSPPLLHRDLRAKNVLLDEEMKPKLSNFGSARFASEQNTMTTDGIGSGRWLAPEVLRGETDYDSASDMYAFGVLLSELDTHAAPYDDALEAHGISESALLERVASGELRPSFSTDCPPQIRELATRCLSQDASVRPTAMQVAYELRLLGREMADDGQE